MPRHHAHRPDVVRSAEVFWEADTYQVTVTDANGLTLFSIAMMSIMAPVMTASPQLKR